MKQDNSSGKQDTFAGLVAEMEWTQEALNSIMSLVVAHRRLSMPPFSVIDVTVTSNTPIPSIGNCLELPSNISMLKTTSGQKKTKPSTKKK